jgi:hypothetical protein
MRRYAVLDLQENCRLHAAVKEQGGIERRLKKKKFGPCLDQSAEPPRGIQGGLLFLTTGRGFSFFEPLYQVHQSAATIIKVRPSSYSPLIEYFSLS